METDYRFCLSVVAGAERRGSEWESTVEMDGARVGKESADGCVNHPEKSNLYADTPGRTLMLIL